MAILETLVAPRHHTLPIRSEWHIDLGRAYAALGFGDAAQGQYRMAMASDEESSAAARDALAGLLDRTDRADLVPDVVGPDGAKYYSLRWVDRGNDQLDFSGAFVLPQNGPTGAAYMTATYRADCAAMTSRMLRGAEFTAQGKRLRDFDKTDFAAPSNALARHALAMVCARDPELGQQRVPSIAGVALTAHYREQRALLAMLKALPPAVCRAQMELFTAKVAEEGEVSGTTWQIRDWWDIAAEDLPKADMDAARERALALSEQNPAFTDALQSACIGKAIAADAVPGL